MTKLEDIPGFLFRAFEAKEHAIDFIKCGKFRLGELAQYRSIEGSVADDVRRDHTEGYGRYLDSSKIQYDFELGNPKYIFSCSLPEVDLEYLRERFGRFVVRINDPKLFVQHIEDNLMSQGIHTFNGIHGRKVEYTKGTMIDCEPDRFELSVIQKPEGYYRESEYRFFTILNQYLGSFIHIDLGQQLHYTEMIS